MSTKEKMFNGKPMSHWRHEADKLLIYILAHEADTVDRRSIVGDMVAERLIHLAKAVNPALYEKTMEEHGWRLENITRALNSMLP